MKICHIQSSHSRYDSRIFMRQCKTLYAHGHEVIEICLDGKGDEIKDGIRIISWSDKLYTQIQRTKLLFGNNDFVDYLLSTKSDIYQIHEFELVTIGYQLCKKEARVIFDSHENWFGMVSNNFKGVLAPLRPFAKFAMHVYYKFTLPKFYKIFSVSPNIVDSLHKYNHNAFMVPNFPTVLNFKAEEKTVEKEDTFVYQGCVYEISNQSATVNAIQSVDAKYIVIGTIEEELKNKIAELDKKNKVKVLGWITPDELKNIMSKCIAGIVVLDYDPVCCGKEGQLGSNKLFEYMLSGLPVICTDFILWKQIVEKYRCGICVPPQNSKAIEESMTYLLQHKDEAIEMGKRGQEAVLSDYNWERYVEHFISYYQE